MRKLNKTNSKEYLLNVRSSENKYVMWFDIFRQEQHQIALCCLIKS